MASTAKILSWCFRHLNIVGCLFERRPTKGGHGHPRTPPSYAPARAVSKLLGTLRWVTTVGWDGWMRIRVAWGHDGKKPRKFSI